MILARRWAAGAAGAVGAVTLVLSPAVAGLGAASPAAGVPVGHVGHVGTHVAAPDVLLGPKGKNAPAVSLDWAGYAVTGTQITTVSGSWTQPTATCTGKPTQSAVWVGIDGFAATDGTVQQVGTDADCTKKVKKSPGGPSYYAWYEMFPGPLVPLPDSDTVTPGDKMSASVTRSGNSYLLALTDAGHWMYSTLQASTTTPQDVSGEWIVEAPTSCQGTKCKPVSLTDFGSVAFTGAMVDGLSIAASGPAANQITMSKNKKGTIVKASTSALDASGDGFDVTWVQN
jgi:hypothetical protein